jgi:hypothetical protein
MRNVREAGIVFFKRSTHCLAGKKHSLLSWREAVIVQLERSNQNCARSSQRWEPTTVSAYWPRSKTFLRRYIKPAGVRVLAWRDIVGMPGPASQARGGDPTPINSVVSPGGGGLRLISRLLTVTRCRVQTLALIFPNCYCLNLNYM